MNNNLLAFCTYGGIIFTKELIKSIENTVKSSYDIFAIIGKPGDIETEEFLLSKNIPYKKHNENYGFPFACNDIYDFAWKDNNYDNLIIMGNDVILYPNCVDELIKTAETTDYKVISALQYDVRDLVREHPETANDFIGSEMKIYDFAREPWKKFTDYGQATNIASMKLYDIQNCCLYTRDYFNVVGYTDVNFYPAYFVDNDLARRIVNSNLRCCSLTNARFFHFWSRVINQEGGGSNHHYFQNNQTYYQQKWGGSFGSETISAPILIDTRINELSTINYWRNR